MRTMVSVGHDLVIRSCFSHAYSNFLVVVLLDFSSPDFVLCLIHAIGISVLYHFISKNDFLFPLDGLVLSSSDAIGDHIGSTNSIALHDSVVFRPVFVQ
jgi:hypothetical protein